LSTSKRFSACKDGNYQLFLERDIFVFFVYIIYNDDDEEEEENINVIKIG
jgi:hypothetical protein